ncbi:histidine phosphatase family protein [uncultured Microbulbifer sp.]|uniref:histidine phosphatase family protein n=1 Tax=uncultured Microbulbifer sp. TaxID=348147 RepID=UPI0026110FAC|nr:histidine phosphatase family protein [uncultured Microbulbifer sp.]
MHQIILIRHGEAAKSATDADPGLTERGQQQAQELIASLDRRFPGGRDVTLVSSPKSRALQTAIPVATHWGKEIHQVPDVIEIPSPQGVPLEKRGAWIRQFLNDSWTSLTPAQNLWREGLLSYLSGLEGPGSKSPDVLGNPDHTTLVFCHFMVINSVVAALKKHNKVAQFFPDYTSQTEIKLDRGILTLTELGQERNTEGEDAGEHRIQ